MVGAEIEGFAAFLRGQRRCLVHLHSTDWINFHTFQFRRSGRPAFKTEDERLFSFLHSSDLIPYSQEYMAEIEQSILGSLEAFLGFARKRLNDPELAADAVQESLLKAMKAAEKPKDEEKMVPWFYQILRRTIIDIYRQTAVRKEALDAFERELPAELTKEDEREICGCFHKLVPTLPAQYRDLIERIDLEGQEPKQVAGDLNVTWNNLNVRLYRARAALRKRLEDTCQACSVHGCLDCTCA